MARSREHFALDWIKGELLETLNTARKGLEAFAEAWESGEVAANFADAAESRDELRACVNALHQAHGTLVMLELKGVTLLADHLERVAEQLMDGSVSDVSGACQSLMQGILELPGYLDELQSGAPDSPAAMLPLVNELRRLLGETPLQEHSGSRMFGTAGDAALRRFESIDGVEKTRRVRAVYQQVLLSLLKGGGLGRAVDTLRKVAQGMGRVCEGTPFEALWEAFGEFVESLAAGAGDGQLDGGAVKLLRRVDSEIREIAQSGRAALQRPVSITLIRQLLDDAAARGRQSELLEDLRDAAASDQKTDGMSLSGRQALVSAATALREELSTIKDRLDLFARGGSADAQQLGELLAPLKQIGSTLSLLGFESSKSIVLDQVDVLAALADGGRADEPAILNVAGALVQVDENLSSLTQSGKGEVERITDEAQRAVAIETREGLERVKQCIVDYVSSQWDVRHLQQAPAELESICGALRMIPLARAAALVDRGEQYVRQELMAGHVPSWEELDRLADALSGIDYYLERMASENPSGAEDVLDVVERSLEGFVTSAPRQTPEDSEALDLRTPEAAPPGLADDLVEASAESAAESAAETVTQPATPVEPLFGGAEEVDVSGVAAEGSEEPELTLETDPDFDLSSELFDAVAEEAAPTAGGLDFAQPDTPAIEEPPTDVSGLELEDPPEELSAVPEPGLPEPELSLVEETEDEAVHVPETSGELEPAIPTEPVVPQTAVPAVASTLADTFDSDDDIVEIFVEEVDEVLAAVDEHLDAWEFRLADEHAQTEIRRAFHTLKGSGRMVGANVLGEMAWSVENMLNRVLDATVAPTAEFVSVVRDARNLTPVLRNAFEAKRAPEMAGVARIMEHADVLASGGTLSDALDLDEVRADDTGAAPTDEHQDLFIAEAEGLLDILGQAQRDETFVLDDDVMRALHTLSGSAAMAGLDAIGALAAPVYELSQALRQPGDATTLTGEVAAYLGEATAAMSALLEDVKSGREPEDQFQLIAEADRLLVLAGEPAGPDPLLSLPAMNVIIQAPEFLDAWQDGAMDMMLAEQVREALGEVAQVAREGGREPVAELAAALLGAHERFEFEVLDDDAHSVLCRAHEHLLAQIDAIAAEQTPQPAAMLLEGLATLAPAASDAELEDQGAPVAAPDAGQVEARDVTSVGDLASQDEEPLPPLPLDEMLAADELPAAEGLSAEVDEWLLDADRTPVEADQAPGSEAQGAEAPADEAPVDEVSAYEALADEMSVDEMSVEADEAPEDEFPGETVGEAAWSGAGEFDAPASDTVESGFGFDDSAEAVPEDHTAAPVAADAGDSAGLLPDDLDEDIIGVFFEEADELMETLDEGISEWSGEPANRLHLETLLRALHTLKGGARLSGLKRLGDETHDFESFLIEFQDSDRVADGLLFDDLHKHYDEIAALLARIRGALGGSPAREEPSAAAEEPPAPMLEEQTASTDNVAPLRPVEATAAPDRPSRPAPSPRTTEAQPEEPVAGKPRGPQEVVRVGAGLLEALVNLAGESSIIRARVEQGMSDFTNALDEMETTIDRLREQLRRLEIETETQVLFRQERRDGPSYEDFDPLEMDRYSQLQQLSRSLSESASDMLDLKETLLYKAREAETLLLQQARVNTELQEGLMRSRMVPFSRLLPRLRRTVRQVARELGKDVDLQAFNVEGELDRSLLERMIPPLEHMLRNAVDHGIETPDTRRAAGKASEGRVDLRLSREGGDVVIEISDDGAGIDVDRVRAKAVERGLMSADAELQDDEISQFVLAPGFSTARSVTQISGRGVGMDVVHSEVKQLGGSIDIHSERGQGTRFVLRVPFTVSVNRALMVSVGDDLYAIPLNTIEGIVLVTQEELDRLYAPDGNTFEYAGVPYRIQYLGSFLGREYRPQPLQGSVPVVLVRSGEQAVAVHVDGVQGSREIVVKSLGPQFAGVGGISGATILGDGSVVVILDLLALIRAQSGSGLASTKRPLKGAARTRCVMVVDDSVTVRKVTSRLLERQGMDVMVAKDGVEAVSMLQERRPDVMLLDIEMPRMDGFEVLRQVRHDERLADLPIVMISSRTGTKHQDRAAGLGVSRFLGKPFQESELLSTIDELVR